MNNRSAEFTDFAKRLSSSSFWLRRLREDGFYISDPLSIDDCRFLPKLSRIDLRDHLDDLLALSNDEDLTGLGWVWSSGSKGPPLRVPRTLQDLRDRWSAYQQVCERHNVDLTLLRSAVLLCVLEKVREYETCLDPMGLLRVSRISTRRKGWTKRVARKDPELLLLSPAGLEKLLEAKLNLRPTAVLSTALFLSSAMRKRAESALACPVINIYSTTETGPLAWECPKHPRVFHCLPHCAFFPGQNGTLVVTRISQSILPLLNYCLDDTGVLVEQTCICGFSGQSIFDFVGRAHK